MPSNPIQIAKNGMRRPKGSYTPNPKPATPVTKSAGVERRARPRAHEAQVLRKPGSVLDGATRFVVTDQNDDSPHTSLRAWTTPPGQTFGPEPRDLNQQHATQLDAVGLRVIEGGEDGLALGMSAGTGNGDHAAERGASAEGGVVRTAPGPKR